MNSASKNNVPQASNPERGNLAIDSDRVEAPVVGAGFMDFGGSQPHDRNNETHFDPFKKSSRTPRSPAKEAARGNTTLEGSGPARETLTTNTGPPGTVDLEAPADDNATDSNPPIKTTSETEAANGRLAVELKKCKETVRKMEAATDRQRNISMDIKRGLAELEESIDIMDTLRTAWQAAMETLESHRQERACENTGQTPTIEPESKKRSATSPIAKEPEKKKKTDENAD